MAQNKPSSLTGSPASGKRRAPAASALAPAAPGVGRLGSAGSHSAVSASAVINKALELSEAGTGRLPKSASKAKTIVQTTAGKAIPAPAKALPRRKSLVHLEDTADGDGLDELLGTLMKKLYGAGIVSTAKMRVRTSRNKERRVTVEYFPDPAQKGAVFLRLVPAALGQDEDESVDEAPRQERRMTTTEVATFLQYSRPYAAKLCDSGVFGPVERSQGGHRRVSFDRVLAYRQERHEMSTALDEMAGLTADARHRDAEQARSRRTASGKAWTRKSGDTTR